ncbi:MAG: class I SAM-dependent RNA methyltransferase [Candidatus Marinimicrobia bacterium]|nr:class I SAM-dependent RNA methyltransferase [Candidatus Neomarinimicrobiota bacterium]
MEFQYQKTGKYFGQIANGLEEMAAEEIQKLGATDVQQRFRGLNFTADLPTMYRINYGSRFLTRVLAPLISFDCHSTKYLHKTAMEIPWEELFSPDQTFAIFAQVSNSAITHSKYASLILKDAIADRFREKTGRRPSVDTKFPDIWFNLHIENNRAVISLDTSGGSLHRRGYRLDTLEAPMQETLAAAVVQLTQWDGSKVFIDPMCGSGTIAAEAYMALTHIPANYFRKTFGFEKMPDFEKSIWQDLRQEMDADISIPEQIPVQASDVDPSALRVAKRNLSHLPGGEGIYTHRKDYREITIPEGATLVMNPPFGIRLHTGEDLSTFYKEVGDWLKQKCQGSEAYIYFGERQYLKNIGLRPEWKLPLAHGGLDGRLAKFVMY